MSSVNSVNPGVSDLLQTFSKSGSAALPSALSSTAVQSALETASPGDLVQLSAQALQLQQVSGLFGGSDTSTATTDPVTALLQALANQPVANAASGSSGASTSGSTTTGSTSSSPATASVATESLAEQEAAALFGTNSPSGTVNNTISLLG